ncbi:hypothetical protein AGMMS50230_19230 [Spirochaetia bacterium]|nr:hypothetical protein AGMMS50230_19230 [Spirochaetia bacterium]
MAGISGIDIKLLGTNAVNRSGMAAEDTHFSRLMEMEKNRDKTPAPRINGGSQLRLTSENDKKLYEQCQALETFLVKNILSAMRKNVMKSSLIDTGYAGEIYEDMLWDEYAKDYTKNAGFGLADLAYLELSGQRGSKVYISG